MKILYAVQGTGNGHITRAIEIIEHLQQKGDLDILVSGIQSDIELPFKVKYKFRGLSFIFGKNGGIDYWKTFLKLKSRKLIKDIKSLKIKEYDLIISDFEPISVWAAIKAKKTCVGLSNQVATLHPLAPKPRKDDVMGKMVLQNYAPTHINYGFHFKSLDKTVFTPIIRKEVREISITDLGHYTVYLPSYDDVKIVKRLNKIPEVAWQVFSKHSKKSYTIGNVSISPIDSKLFLNSIASSSGVLTNAGFGTTSEALFLKKKLLVVPMKKQYEQQCNAAMLQDMGIKVIKKFDKKSIDLINNWVKSDTIIEVDYQDNTEEIIDLIIENHKKNKNKFSS
ncbi:MAG: glycosyltransferase family protein [Flavobacterium sp.]